MWPGDVIIDFNSGSSSIAVCIYSTRKQKAKQSTVAGRYTTLAEETPLRNTISRYGAQFMIHLPLQDIDCDFCPIFYADKKAMTSFTIMTVPLIPCRFEPPFAPLYHGLSCTDPRFIRSIPPWLCTLFCCGYLPSFLLCQCIFRPPGPWLLGF